MTRKFNKVSGPAHHSSKRIHNQTYKMTSFTIQRYGDFNNILICYHRNCSAPPTQPITDEDKRTKQYAPTQEVRFEACDTYSNLSRLQTDTEVCVCKIAEAGHKWSRDSRLFPCLQSLHWRFFAKFEAIRLGTIISSNGITHHATRRVKQLRQTGKRHSARNVLKSIPRIIVDVAVNQPYHAR